MTLSAKAELGSITSTRTTGNRRCDIGISNALPTSLIPATTHRLPPPNNDLRKDHLRPNLRLRRLRCSNGPAPKPQQTSPIAASSAAGEDTTNLSPADFNSLTTASPSPNRRTHQHNSNDDQHGVHGLLSATYWVLNYIGQRVVRSGGRSRVQAGHFSFPRQKKHRHRQDLPLYSSN
jgi:hypothetical protein